VSEAIRFSRSLYDRRAVDRAVEAFDALATFTVAEEDDAFVVTIADPDPDVADVLADELGNHVLGHTVTLRAGSLVGGAPL